MGFLPPRDAIAPPTRKLPRRPPGSFVWRQLPIGRAPGRAGIAMPKKNAHAARAAAVPDDEFAELAVAVDEGLCRASPSGPASP